MVGYATVYTMFPVFSLVLDKDVSGRIALTYPELYKDLAKGRSLTYKTFFIWCLISIYQGGIIMFGALLLFEDEFIHVVSISFTALIMTELIMVALTIRTWHWLMVLAEFLSLVIYMASLAILHDFFGRLICNLCTFTKDFNFRFGVCENYRFHLEDGSDHRCFLCSTLLYQVSEEEILSIRLSKTILVPNF